MQTKLRSQIEFNKARVDYLRMLWDTAVTDYKNGLKKTKKRVTSVLAKIPKRLIDLLLTLYIERCKFKHTMVFIQFRKLLPEPKLHDLREIFDQRKEFFLSKI